MKERNQQSGFALLIFIVVLLGVLGLVGSDLMQSRAKSNLNQKIQHDQEVLNKARQALLSYAVEYKKQGDVVEMGRLPCPDTSAAGTEGEQDGNCGVTHANNAGYLPWKALGIEALRDSSGECLWYVVSGEYKDTPVAGMLNEDSNGLLQIEDESGQTYHGSSPSDRPIAAIIAPGPALSGQNRTPNPAMTECRGNYIEDNYLEGGSLINYSSNHNNIADNIWRYLYGSATNNLDNNTYNDRIVWITKSEYWDAVKAQGDLDATDSTKDINILTKRLAECVAAYASDTENGAHWLPWPAPVDLSDYRTNALYQDQNNPTLLFGRFPVSITNSNANETGSQSAAMTGFITTCLTSDEFGLWSQWKDHFFYLVSEGFEMVDGDSDSDLEDRCHSNKCVEIPDGTADKVAALIFYSGSVSSGQTRNYDPVDTDTKNLLKNYLETEVANKSNAHQYPVDVTYTGDIEKYYRDIGDITYCVEVNSTSFFVTDCNP